MNKGVIMKVATLFEEVTGLYHYCDNSLPYLDARGKGFSTQAEAKNSAKDAGFSHIIDTKGRKRKL
jgi:hypothetical protein